MMAREIVRSPVAPAAIGPYSQGVRSGGLLFCSGQIPLDPATGKMVEGGIAEQTERVLRNLEAVLSAGGASSPRTSCRRRRRNPGSPASSGGW